MQSLPKTQKRIKTKKEVRQKAELLFWSVVEVRRLELRASWSPKNLGVPLSAYFRAFPPLSARKRILSGALTSTVSVCDRRVCGINCGQAKHPECSVPPHPRCFFVVCMVTLSAPKVKAFAEQILPRSRQRKEPMKNLMVPHRFFI